MHLQGRNMRKPASRRRASGSSRPNKWVLAVSVLAALSLALLALLLVSRPGPGEIGSTDVNTADLGYYRESWETSRAQFRELGEIAKLRYRGAESGVIPVPDRVDADLAVDWLYVPPDGAPAGALTGAPSGEKRVLVVVSSGIHGAEGFAGSAVQAQLLTEYLPGADLGATGFLFIHGINPYGMKHWRRFTGNNVDLNRNSPVTPGVYTTPNAEYGALDAFLNPAGKVDLRRLSEKTFDLRMLWLVVTRGKKAFRQASVGGQYRYPDGIFYGGAAPEPQMPAIGDLIRSKAAPYSSILGLDLHTGVGRRSYMHLMTNAGKDEAYHKRAESIFSGHPLDWPEGDDFYLTSGDFTTWLEAIAAPRPAIAVTVEFGTLDSQTTRGAIKSLWNMIHENQGRRFGYARPADARRVAENYREMFFPSSRVWRSEVLRQSRESLFPAIDRASAPQ